MRAGKERKAQKQRSPGKESERLNDPAINCGAKHFGFLLSQE
jgi:hypothetical protein